MAKTDKNPHPKREFDEALARFVKAKVANHLAEGGDLASLEILLHQAVMDVMDEGMARALSKDDIPPPPDRTAKSGGGPSGKAAGKPAEDPASFTERQGQYLAFIHMYTSVHRRPPAQADIQHYFKVSPPSVHQMVLTLERRGLLRRVPGQARSLEVLVPAEQLPTLR